MAVPLHPWTGLSPTDAIALQKTLAGQIDVHSRLDSFDLVAGADCSYTRFSPRFFAAIVVWSVRKKMIVETAEAVGTCAFPYVPGLLSFREAPIVLDAFAKLRCRPDVVMVDGQGYAHPRRLGIASHLGLWLDLPTFGCAKSRLIGTFDEPASVRGSTSPLLDREEQIGMVVRTRDRVRPLFVSAGHRIDLESSVRIVLACGQGYRLPEPTRKAHRQVNEVRLRRRASSA